MTEPLTRVTSSQPSIVIAQAQGSLLLLMIRIYWPLQAELHQLLSSGHEAVIDFLS